MQAQLTDADRTALCADGFVAIPEMVAADEVASIRHTLEALHARNAGFREGAQYDALGVDDGMGEKRFPQIMNPRFFAPALTSTAFHRRAHAMAVQMFGPGVRLKADISFMKPARTGPPTPWHQDEAFLDPAFDYHELSFWLALQTTDQTNSCMEFIAGSHAGPVLPHGHPGGDPRIHALECVAGFDPAAARPCPLPAGGCTIHMPRTLHYAGPNGAAEPRLAYVVIFGLAPTPARAPRSFPWLQQWNTAGHARARAWRRQGGILVLVWRHRRRLWGQSTLVARRLLVPRRHHGATRHGQSDGAER